MLKFLLKRPIAVSMSFIAILLLGIVAIGRLPISLMPDVDIPQLTIKINYPQAAASEMESTIITPIRRQLIQLTTLEDIHSESKDGQGIIRLQLHYGSNINLAYIEANEKIDWIMGHLPKDMDRPQVIKASASDLPVFYLNISMKTQQTAQSFMDMSQFASRVIGKRLEQLPAVAMVDISGLEQAQISIIPDQQKMESLGIDFQDLEQTILKNNLEFGSLNIKDGYYRYQVRFASQLNDKRDIEEIYLPITGKLIQLKDIAEVKLLPQERKGAVLYNGTPALSLAIIKQSDAKIYEMEEHLQELITIFEKDYPNIRFDITQDQTLLLDYSIANLRQSLLWGAALAFLVMFFFLKDFRAPWLIGVSIPASIIISLLAFHLIGISLNIISLSGLILGIGMMIDNSIIVIDNISQYRDRGENLFNACRKGTNEVIKPMLSSVLTTCAVFLPLIFISGIAGALFYDQAVAVSVGLLVSFAVSITLLPVYYRLFYKEEKSGRMDRMVARLSGINYEALYEKGLKLCFRHQMISTLIFSFLTLSGVLLFFHLKKERMPGLEQKEFVVQLNWNERIHMDENKNRVIGLIKTLGPQAKVHTEWIGVQDYALNKQNDLSQQEALIYINTATEEERKMVEQQVQAFLQSNYPEAAYQFKPPANLFEQVFASNEAPLSLRLSFNQLEEHQEIKQFKRMQQQFIQLFPNKVQAQEISHSQLELRVNPAKVKAYGLDHEKIYYQLRNLFNHSQVSSLRNNSTYIPILIGEKPESVYHLIQSNHIKNEAGDTYPLSELIEIKHIHGFKKIEAGKEGSYLPIHMEVEESDIKEIQAKSEELLKVYPEVNYSWTGSIFQNQSLMKSLGFILLISLLLLYFILAAQFESLTQPLIVILEVPIDIGGAFIFLWIFGGTINLMSAIGIIVMAGIIINDSILKIDTINRLRREEGYGVLRAISVAGQRRLKPILMTSITTILALIPILFSSGLGADLQKPLALAVIGGMGIGTIVSLYFIPLMYYWGSAGKNNRNTVETH